MRLIQLLETVEANWVEDYVDGEPRVRVRTRDGLVPPQYVYRVMSRAEYEAAQQRGAFHPGRDGRIHASASPELRYRNSPDDVVVQIRYRDEDGWRAKWGDQLYAITDKPVPFSLVIRAVIPND